MCILLRNGSVAEAFYAANNFSENYKVDILILNNLTKHYKRKLNREEYAKLQECTWSEVVNFFEQNKPLSQ